MDRLKALKQWIENERKDVINYEAKEAYRKVITQINILMVVPCIRCGKKTLADSLHTCTPLPGSMDSYHDE